MEKLLSEQKDRKTKPGKWKQKIHVQMIRKQEKYLLIWKNYEYDLHKRSFRRTVSQTLWLEIMLEKNHYVFELMD